MIMKKLNLHKWLHLTVSVLVLEFKTAAVFKIFEVNPTDQSCIQKILIDPQFGSRR